MSNLYSKINYVTDRDVILGGRIIEYDIRKANINILRAFDMIDPDTYYKLLYSDQFDKMVREVYVGNMIKKEINKSEEDGNIDTRKMSNSPTYNTIKNGILEAKKRLFIMNNIQDHEVIRIANDAVYINRIDNIPYTSFNIGVNDHPVAFVPKKVYRSMVKFGRVIVFLSTDKDGNFDVDVIGINNELLFLHQNFLGFLCEMIIGMEFSDTRSLLTQFNIFYEDYINKRLDISYYLEFNAESSIRIKGTHFAGRFIDNKYIDKVDINYNLNILRTLYSYILQNHQ